MSNRRFRSSKLALVAAFALALGGALATPGAVSGTERAINMNDRVPLSGNVHPLARSASELRRSDPNLAMERMILSLAGRPGASADLGQLLAEQHNPASPLYHQWLTPQQFGARFGLSDADLSTVTSWLKSQGFKIDEVAKGRGWINFSGNAEQVERAFATEIHDYLVDGVVRHANAIDPSIPRGLSGLVHGIVSLHNFPMPSLHTEARRVVPEELTPRYTSSGLHYLAPADFATIYDLNSLYAAGIDGHVVPVGIVGRTDINLADVQYFRSFFGLPVNDPLFIHNGPAPGNLGGKEEIEGDLDVEWAGAVAPKAPVKFIISKSTSTTDGVDLSAQYIVNDNSVAAMSTSFGQCESFMGTTKLAFYNNLWSQAASQGITSFVAAGDAGAAGCNVGGNTTGSGVAVNGLCSTPWNVCVGGTQFNDTASPSTYWSATNNGTTQGSALSYIPEVAWNESGTVTGGSDLWSTGGGASTIYAKPSWQVAPGVPADRRRDIPDVSLSAAGHDGYLIIQGHTSTVSGLFSVGGTSAASPSFAGLMSLVVLKTSSRQGNANTVLYPMAVSQLGGTGVAAFHDVTSGNNTVPGVTGFSAGTGYDRVTGLGSVDGALLVNHWGGSTPSFTLSALPSSVSVAQGGSGSSTVATRIAGGFNSAISLSATGQPAGVNVVFSPTSIAAPGAGYSSMSITVDPTTPQGAYPITITGTGGGVTQTTTVALIITPDFTITASPGLTAILIGTSGNVSIATAISGGFNSAITLTASNLPTGVTAAFSPTSIAAPGAGTSTLTLTVTSSAAVGTYSIRVSGNGGGFNHIATVTLTVMNGTTQLIGNPGFENGSGSPAPWTVTSGVIDNSTPEPAHSGTWKAWMDGYGTAHTDSILQTVTIPATAGAATLTFWLHIDTAETTTTTPNDTLKVQLRNTSGTVLSTLATYSNLNANTGYAQKSFDVTFFKGQTIQVFLVGTENSSLQTSFVVDDLTLNEYH